MDGASNDGIRRMHDELTKHTMLISSSAQKLPTDLMKLFVTCFLQKMEVLLFFNFHSSSSRIWSADIQDSRIPLSHFNCLKYSSISSRPHPKALLLSIISADVGRIVVVSSYLFCQCLTANQSQFERLLAGRASEASPTSKSPFISVHIPFIFIVHIATQLSVHTFIIKIFAHFQFRLDTIYWFIYLFIYFGKSVAVRSTGNPLGDMTLEPEPVFKSRKVHSSSFIGQGPIDLFIWNSLEQLLV